MNIVALESIDGEIIPLVNIESINVGTKFLEDQQATFNVLKGDMYIRVTTHSGFRHICSVLDAIKTLEKEQEIVLSVDDCYYQVIYPSWKSVWDSSNVEIDHFTKPWI